MPRTRAKLESREADLEGTAAIFLSALLGSSLASKGSFMTLDISFDATVVCQLSAADEDEIQELVASIVCQRRVWNITLLIVGIQL